MTPKIVRVDTWRWRLVLPALVVLFSTGTMAALGGFNGLYGQDAYAYYDYAVGPLLESLRRLSPPPPFFWPPGFPLLVAVVSVALGRVPLAGQIVSLTAGALVPVFTVLLAEEVWVSRYGRRDAQQVHLGPVKFVSSAPRTAWLAGLLVAFTGQLWQSSAVVMSDTASLAAATLGVWALVRYSRLGDEPARDRGHLRWLMLAAVALSWAVLTRWAYALVAVPCAGFALIMLIRRGGRTALAHAGSAALVAGIFLAPVFRPAIDVLLTPVQETVSFAGDLQVYSWHPSLAFRREFTTIDGVLRYRFPNGLYYAIAPAHWFYLTPILAPLIPLGLWTAIRRRPTLPVWLLVAWGAVVYGFHAGAPWQSLRFTLAYLPPVAILAAIGLESMLSTAGTRRARLISIYFVLGLFAMATGGVRLTQRFIERKHDHLEIVRWVESRTPPDARLLTFGLTATFQHNSRLETVELFELDSREMFEYSSNDRAAFLLLEDGIEQQWGGLAPDVNYRWLRDGPGLEEMGRRQGYTLYRIRESSLGRTDTFP